MASPVSPRSRWLDQFVRELAREGDDMTGREFQVWQRRIVTDAFTMVVERTPVDYGLARANWYIGINRIPSSILHTDFDADVSAPKKEAAAVSMARLKTALPKIKPFDHVNIVNNVPYMEVLESGGFVPTDPGPSEDERPHRFGRVWVRHGYSVQAPRGIVRNALWRLTRKY